MSYARYLAALLCLATIGCGESEGPSEGMLESNFVADGGGVFGPRDNSTDPAVTLLHADDDATEMRSDAGAPPPIVDAGSVESEEPVEPDATVPDSGSEPEPPVTEPDPPDDDDDDDNGGLVGTVCDLLGGLLCPVGLLCVDGLCQQPTD